jgi:hypothetical protein
VNTLRFIALGVGAVSITKALWGLNSPESAKRFLRELPRNETVGRILMLIDTIWALYLLGKLNLGDWNWIKPVVFTLSPVIYFYIIFFVNHYLGARSLALLLILAAKPVLWICFLRDDPARLIMTSIAYLWIIMGICFFSAPHWLRDCIAFFESNPRRWDWGCRTKFVFGLSLVALGIFVY